ncbi:MAG: prolyl oligopeptidase family serine peptidase [Gammaproteobacteria bacterium]|nr:prolyl oligopeptidase family serine peptidase [Gammaproteobacteria bacterium]
MYFQSRLIFLLITTMAVTGCISRVHAPLSLSQERESVLNNYETDKLFSYEPKKLAFDNHMRDDLEKKNFLVREITFQSTGKNGQDNNQVTAHYYQSRQPGKKNLVIILPIWGSYKYPSEKIGNGVRRRGSGETNVLMLQGESPLFDWERMYTVESEQQFRDMLWHQAERLRYTSLDVRRLIDWAETREEIDTDKIVLVGFSMGAIVTALAIANEPRFAGAVLVMGGANLGEIMRICDGKMEEMRNAVMPKFDWDLDYYEGIARDSFAHVNPTNFPDRVDPRKVLFIDAHNDDCMPQTSRDALWHALGNPERISYKYGHHGAFLAMTPLGFNIMRRQIYTFIEQVLQAP